MAKTGKCIYCGTTKELTVDHIPSKNLHKGFEVKTPITIPACLDCNQGFQKDEEYFRNLIVGIMAEDSQIAKAVFDGPVMRSITKSPGLGWSIFKKMAPVNIYKNTGEYVGKAAVHRMEDEDHKRIFNVLDKYVKGLNYYTFNKPIEANFAIQHFWTKQPLIDQIIKEKSKYNWKVVAENIFIFGYNFVPDKGESVWILVFFNRPFFVSFVLAEDHYKELNKQDD